MIAFIIEIFLLLSLSNAQEIQEFPNHVNKSACISIKSLRNLTVQRGLGEARKIRKVNLYLIGDGDVGVTVGIATRFLDQESSNPVIHKCGEYNGHSNNLMITFNCLEEGADDDQDGITAHAVYAKFNADAVNQQTFICQMDIVSRNTELKRQRMQLLGIFFGVICGLIIVTGLGFTFWYFWINRRERVLEDKIMEGVHYSFEELNNPVQDTNHEKKPLPNWQASRESEYDDEVFER